MRKRRVVRKPFKGSFFYEWQIGPFVMQVKRKDYDSPHFRKFHVWYDNLWRGYRA